jgi:hypothetical protein
LFPACQGLWAISKGDSSSPFAFGPCLPWPFASLQLWVLSGLRPSAGVPAIPDPSPTLWLVAHFRVRQRGVLYHTAPSLSRALATSFASSLPALPPGWPPLGSPARGTTRVIYHNGLSLSSFFGPKMANPGNLPNLVRAGVTPRVVEVRRPPKAIEGTEVYWRHRLTCSFPFSASKLGRRGANLSRFAHRGRDSGPARPSRMDTDTHTSRQGHLIWPASHSHPVPFIFFVPLLLALPVALRRCLPHWR